MLSNLKKSTIGRIYIYLYVCVCVKNVVQPTCSINNRRKASSAHQDVDPQILDKTSFDTRAMPRVIFFIKNI